MAAVLRVTKSKKRANVCMCDNIPTSHSGSPLARSGGSFGLGDPQGIYLPETYRVLPPDFSICRILWQRITCVCSPWCGKPHFSPLNWLLLTLWYFFPPVFSNEMEWERMRKLGGERTSVIPVPSVVLVILQACVTLSSLSYIFF